MSWVFALLLSMYAVVRGSFWLRGQLRYLSIRRELQPPAPRIRERPPAHLSEGLAELWLHTHELRDFALNARHTIAVVRVTDPDSPLGVIRDPRYRRAVIESRNRARKWLRAVEALEPHERSEFDHYGGQSTSLGGGVRALDEAYQRASRSRALEPFPMAEVERSLATLETVCEALDGVHQRLAEPRQHAYRPVLSDPAASGAFVG